MLSYLLCQLSPRGRLLPLTSQMSNWMMSLEASSPSQHSNSSASRPSLPFSQVMPSSKSSLASFPLDMFSLTSPGTRPTIVPSSTSVFLFSLSAFTSFLTQLLSCILLSFTDFPSTSRAPRLSLFWKSLFAFGGISTTSSLCWWPMNPYLQPWTSTHGRLTSSLRGTFHALPWAHSQRAFPLCSLAQWMATRHPVSQARSLSYSSLTSFSLTHIFIQMSVLRIMPSKYSQIHSFSSLCFHSNTGNHELPPR